MLISLLISLLVSNAVTLRRDKSILFSRIVTLRRDKSILFSRIVITELLFASFLALNNLFTKTLEKGIGIYRGLFNVRIFTHSSNTFVFLISAITLFSFVGVPPLIGFFAKQMGLSAALDNGYIFMTLVAILTSVIGAGYYLNKTNFLF